MTTLIPKYDQGAAGTVNRPIDLKLGEFISVKDFGAVGDGTTNDAAAFTAAFAAIVATGKKGVVYVPSGTYKINSSLTVNISFVSIWGESATLNFSSLTSGAALVINSTVSPPYANAITSISGLQLVGNSKAGSVKGIQYTSSTDVSHVSVDNCSINNFGVGESFETNSYLISHKNTDVWACTIGVQNLTGFANNGENISYIGGAIFNNGTNVVQNNGAGDMFFTNVSLDFPDTAHISITAGNLYFANCHIEGGSVPVFSNNVVNSITNFTNCYFIQQTSSGATPYMTIAGAVVITGGRLFAPNATSPVITVSSGGSLNCSFAYLQYAGSTLFNLVSGCFYTIVSQFPIQIAGYFGTIHTSGNIGGKAGATFGDAVNVNSGGGFVSLNNSAINLLNSTTGMGFAGSAFSWIVSASRILDASAGNLQPGADNVTDLGSAVFRWETVYAGTGTINTSDRNDKQQIAELTTAEKAVAQALKGMIKTFKFNDAVRKKGPLARIHTGVIAQDVKAAFIAQELNPDNYGVFCSDTWYEVDGEPCGKDFVLYTKDTPNAIAKTRLGVRYDELFAFIIAGL
jgi:hypothetical protein